jgi:hypothetical protein
MRATHNAKKQKRKKKNQRANRHGHDRAIFDIEKYDRRITGGRFFAYRHFNISLSISGRSITVIGPGGWLLVVPTEMQSNSEILNVGFENFRLANP